MKPFYDFNVFIRKKIKCSKKYLELGLDKTRKIR